MKHKEPTNQDLMKSMQRLHGTVQSLSGTVQGLSGTVQGLSATVQDMQGAFQGMQGTVQELQGTVHGLQGTVGGLQGTVGGLQTTVQSLQIGQDAILKAVEKSQQDILETMNAFATDTETRLLRVESKITNIDSRLTRVESTMVTKEYLDDKLTDIRGDLVLLARKGNKKLETVIEELVTSRVLKRAVADRILAMEPFAQRV